jgi:shikimate kinase
MAAVFLIGFMGAGKTSVGQALGRRLGWPFEDLDDRITARAGRTIEQVFRESGEAEFRRLEHAALHELLSGLEAAPRVVALGGGAFVQAENARLLEESGAKIAFLDAPVEELWRRCTEQDLKRPLQQDKQQFRQLYEQRRAHYGKAPLRIETSGKEVEVVAEEVMLKLGLQPKGKP